MQQSVIIIFIIVIVIVSAFIVRWMYKKEEEKYLIEYRLNSPNANQGNGYDLINQAYSPYPDGEFIVDPMYTEKKKIDLKNVNEFTGVPVGMFQKGVWNSEYTPDLQRCNNA